MKKIIKIMFMCCAVFIFCFSFGLFGRYSGIRDEVAERKIENNELDLPISDTNSASIVSDESDLSIADTKVTGKENDYRQVPILMYHSLLKESKGTYIVSPANFESDIIWLKTHGYTPVFLNDLKAFALGKANLPKKPVVITFDDGNHNNLYYGLPILKKHNARAEINIIGAFTENCSSSGEKNNPNYSSLTWQQVSEIYESGYFEIGNHTYNMHQLKPRYGVMKCSGENISSYKANLEKDLNLMQNCLRKKSNIKTTIFAYPFGKYDQNSENIIKNLGFDILLTCLEGVNTISRGNVDGLTRLKRFNRTGTMSTDAFFAKIKI